MQSRIQKYICKWKRQGYPAGISDEVPTALMDENLAPSYRAIALAILKNDHQLTSLGFSPTQSEWYSAIKRIELRARNGRC